MSVDHETKMKWATAALRVFSERLMPEQITAIIGRKPTRSYTKGDRLGTGKSPVRHENVWLLESDVAQDKDVAAHLERLLEIVEPRIDAVRILCETCKVDLFCGFSSTHGQGGTMLSRHLLNRLSALRLDLRIDLYPPGSITVEDL